MRRGGFSDETPNSLFDSQELPTLVNAKTIQV